MSPQRIFLLIIVVLMMGMAVVSSPDQVQAIEKNKTFNIANMTVDEFFPNKQGTFILRDLETGKTFIYNEEKAKERQAPESTFKVMSSLIGLQVKAVKDEYDVKRWDGVTRDFSTWNQDQTLGSMMRYSVVWYNQAMIRDIGQQRMQEWLERCSYGNQDISGGLDSFWLNSSLKISPLEQADFMEKLYKEELPFDKEVMKTVKRIMIQQEGDEYVLYGKTGSKKTPVVGWYTGFIVSHGHPYVFVTYLEAPGEKYGGPKAKEITLKILEKYNLISK